MIYQQKKYYILYIVFDNILSIKTINIKKIFTFLYKYLL
jgi:hypothetical protein